MNVSEDLDNLLNKLFSEEARHRTIVVAVSQGLTNKPEHLRIAKEFVDYSRLEEAVTGHFEIQVLGVQQARSEAEKLDQKKLKEMSCQERDYNKFRAAYELLFMFEDAATYSSKHGDHVAANTYTALARVFSSPADMLSVLLAYKSPAQYAAEKEYSDMIEKFIADLCDSSKIVT